jgi:hypothetical protein
MRSRGQFAAFTRVDGLVAAKLAERSLVLPAIGGKI